MVFGKFTERAQTVLVEAQKESQYFKHGYIGTEHILLGILREGGFANKVLYISGITIDKARKLIEEYLGFGDVDISIGEMLLNPRTKRVFDDSLAKSMMYNHNAINPEHILLALLDDVESVAYTIISTLKVDIKAMKNELINYINKSDSKDIKQSDEKKKSGVKTPMLNQYGKNLTILANEGRLDPVIGRESENKRILKYYVEEIRIIHV